jgi:predicted nuclease of predicted toxin-antitoxin system
MAERVSYYLDENVATSIAKGLRQRGVDVLMTVDADMLGVSDEQQLSFAASDGRVLFTKDDDFLKLHAEGFRHAGIVFCRQHHLSVGETIHGLMLIYEVLTSAEMMNHVEYL